MKRPLTPKSEMMKAMHLASNAGRADMADYLARRYSSYDTKRIQDGTEASVAGQESRETGQEKSEATRVAG